jgi:hypothetical protein
VKMLPGVVATSLAFIAASADAQDLATNLSGRYICVQNCLAAGPGNFAYVTQNGWDLNFVDDAGQPSRAWLHWDGRIWAEDYQQHAIASPDGLQIQFDQGTVWQRDIGVPAAVVMRHWTAQHPPQ